MPASTASIAILTAVTNAGLVTEIIAALQVPVEIPTTVIGLVAFVVMSETALVYLLLKQLFSLSAQYADLASKNAEGAAAVANGLREVATAVQQGRDVDTLKKQIDALSLQVKTPKSRGRSGTN